MSSFYSPNEKEWIWTHCKCLKRGRLITTHGRGIPVYSISKVALNALTRKLAAELRGSGILVNSFDFGRVTPDTGGPRGRPVFEGAKGIVLAATLLDNGPSGEFLYDGKPELW